MDLKPGERIGAFEIIGALGAGGMGEVYRARDTRLSREVALKVLPRSVSQDPARLARFDREARVLAALNHPGIGAIYGIEDSPNGPLLVLELVPGETLADVLRKGPLPPTEAITLCRKIADAVAFAHANGVVHRDLKPANIKCTPQGAVKVLDFGIAKALASESTGAMSSDPTIAVAGTTAAGVLLGTPAYMSPEQARSKEVDRRTDIWALGCILYEALTGRQLFQRATVTDTLIAVLSDEPDWSALPPKAPHALRAILRRCLQRDPNRRYHDVADVRVELDDVLDEAPELPTGAAANQPRLRRTDGVNLELGLVVLLALAIAGRVLVRTRLVPPLTTSIESVALAYTRPTQLYFWTLAFVEPVLIAMAILAWAAVALKWPGLQARVRRGSLAAVTVAMTTFTIGGLYLIASQAVLQVMRLNDAQPTAFVERDIVSLHLASGNAAAVIAMLDPQHTRDHPAKGIVGWHAPGEAFQLAEAYAQAGDVEAARRLYKRAEESATTFDEVLSERAQLTKTKWRTEYGLDTEWGLTVHELRELPALVRAVSERRLQQLDAGARAERR